MSPRKGKILFVVIFILGWTLCGLQAVYLSINWPRMIFPPKQLVDHHISQFHESETNLYFGAGYCLYKLETNVFDMKEIVCVDGWTFQRPILNSGKIYSQVITEPDEDAFLVALDVRTGDIIWQYEQIAGQSGPWRNIRDNLAIRENQIVAANRKEIHSIDIDTGKTMWHQTDNYFNKFFPFLIQDGMVWYLKRSDRKSK